MAFSECEESYLLGAAESFWDAVAAACRTQLEPQHADYPHEAGRLYDCAACESSCHCTPGDAESVYHGEHNGAAAQTLCCNCGRTSAQAGCLLRTRVIDWRTELMCDTCVASYDWADWHASVQDGLATMTHK